METYGYMATATTPDHDQAAVVELRCTRPDLLTFPPFMELAKKICQRLLECPPMREPKFLDRDNIDAEAKERLQQECRHAALQRGSSKEDTKIYASRLYQKRLGELCLHEMTFEGKSVAAHITDLSHNLGHIYVGRFFKVTVYD